MTPVKDAAREAVDRAARRPASARGSQRSELIYRPARSNGYSWLRDLAGAGGDAYLRLEANNRQAREEGALERAGFTQTAGAGGEAVPPTYLLEMFAPALRAGRPFLNMLGTHEFPQAPLGQSLNFPKFTGGASTAVQTDGSAVSNTDPTTSLVTAQIQTTAGRTIYSWQMVDLNPYTEETLIKDLVFDLATKMDAAAISGAVTNAKGILNTASINAVTFTSASPTLTLLWPFALQAASAIARLGGVAPELAVTHPSAWYSFASTADAAHPGLVIPGLGNDTSDAADA
jgi:HK97 family phage major capsid protein